MIAKNTMNVRVEPLVLDSLLTMAKASIGSAMFREFYAKVNGEKQEVLRGGKLSCAFFITSLLKVFGLIGETQITVHRAIDDMVRSGWYEINSAKAGAVVIWAPKPADPQRIARDKATYSPTTRHMGICLDGVNAISNGGDTTESPVIHPINIHETERYYWHKALDDNSSLHWQKI